MELQTKQPKFFVILWLMRCLPLKHSCLRSKKSILINQLQGISSNAHASCLASISVITVSLVAWCIKTIHNISIDPHPFLFPITHLKIFCQPFSCFARSLG